MKEFNFKLKKGEERRRKKIELREVFNEYYRIFDLEDKLKTREKRSLESNVTGLISLWNEKIKEAIDSEGSLNERALNELELKEQSPEIYISTVFFIHELLESGNRSDTLKRKLIKQINKYLEMEPPERAGLPALNFDDYIYLIWLDAKKHGGILELIDRRAIRSYLKEALELDGFKQEDLLQEEAQKLIDLGLADTVITIKEINL